MIACIEDTVTFRLIYMDAAHALFANEARQLTQGGECLGFDEDHIAGHAAKQAELLAFGIKPDGDRLQIGFPMSDLAGGGSRNKA